MGLFFSRKSREPAKPQITEQDKAVLALKQQRDKLKQYQKKVTKLSLSGGSVSVAPTVPVAKAPISVEPAAAQSTAASAPVSSGVNGTQVADSKKETNESEAVHNGHLPQTEIQMRIICPPSDEAQVTKLRLSGGSVSVAPTVPVAKAPISVEPAAAPVSSGVNGTQVTDSKKETDETPQVVAETSFLTKLLRDKLVKTTNEVEVQRKDPNSPLYSVKSFEELPLSQDLRRGVYEMGFNKPSKIQETALPMLLADPPNNMIAQSQSGTGKTAAFVLAMLSRVDALKPYPQVLCLSPTYELAIQTGKVVEQMGKFCPEIKVCYAVRGEKVGRGHKTQDHIVIGTPGTVLDWIMRHKKFDPRKISVFVLDEADFMIALQGHQDQSITIHKHLSHDCQMLLFSAIYDEQVMKFAQDIVPNPVIIQLPLNLDNIKQFYVKCRNQEEKFQALSNMYGVVSMGQCMVFCHTRRSAAWLTEKMSAEGHAVAMLTGEITVEQRIAVLNRYREGKEKLLITTNVCARGIDVEQVTVVINYDVPVDVNGKPDYETYLHRIGRTGSFAKTGIAVNFIDGQKSLAIMHKIGEHFGKKIEHLQTDDVEELEKLS